MPHSTRAARTNRVSRSSAGGATALASAPRKRPAAPPRADGTRWAIFDTKLGPAAVRWGPTGVCGALLPGEGGAEEATWRWPLARPAVPPRSVRDLCRRVAAHAAGASDAFADVPLDLGPVSGFDRAVYVAARDVAPGEVVTYGELARRIGRPGAARAVGGALGRNPIPLFVPCHRIVGASGIGGFSSTGGLVTKRRLLAVEGVRI
jgi:methylated-DNA-[protein]-cysteine S-methyltransferase